MAYVARQTESQRLATIGIVLLVHVALGALLVTEFASGLIGQIMPPAHIRTFDVKPRPEPPQPKNDTKQATHGVTKTTIDVIEVEPAFTPLNPDPIHFEPPIFGGPIPRPSAGDGLQKPGFAPKGATPANDQSRWVTDDDYPGISIKYTEHGITVFRVTVGTDGRVKACEIVKSSGHTRLDNAACRFVTLRAEFNPAGDKAGTKVVGTYTNSVSWRLPD